MAIIDELIAILGYDVRGEDQLRRFNAGLDRTEQYARGAAGRISALGVAVGTFLGHAAYEAVSRLSTAIGSFPGDIIRTGATFENLTVQLTALEGSADGAERALAWIKRFARDTPLSLEQVTKSYADLKNFGLDPTNGTLQALTDTMAMSGKGAEHMSGIILAVGQAWSKQKLQGEEILQLVERGVPVWDLLSKATGKSVGELNKLSSAGKLGRKEIQLLIDAMGKRAAGQADKMAQTFDGLTGKISDTWQQFQLLVADSGWFDFVKKNTEELGKAFDDFMNSDRAKRYASAISNFMVRTAQAIGRFGRSVWRMGEFAASGFERVGKAAADLLRFLSGNKIDLSNWEGFAAAVGLLFVYFAPLTSIIIAAGLAIDDFLTYLEGGDSVIGDFIANLPNFVTAFDNIAPGVRSAVQSTIALLREGDWAGAGIMAQEAFLRGWTSLSSGLQPYVDQAMTALSSADWGNAISDGVSKATVTIEGIDWGDVGAEGGRIGTLIAAALVSALLKEFHAASVALGTAIKSGLTNISWSGVGGLIVSSLKAQFNLLTGIVTGISQQIISTVEGWFSINLTGIGARWGRELLAGLSSMGGAIRDWFASLIPGWAKEWFGTANEKLGAVNAGERVGAMVPPPTTGKGPAILEDRATRERQPSSTVPNMLNGMDQLRSMLQNMNGNLAKMTPAQAVDATITDARQDNRQFPMNVTTNITQNVQQATQAPAAAAQATGAAVSGAATNQAARIQQEPAF